MSPFILAVRLTLNPRFNPLDEKFAPINTDKSNAPRRKESALIVDGFVPRSLKSESQDRFSTIL